MSRNLLPRLRRVPNPANIPQATIGDWTRLAAPGDLSKLDYGAERENEARARVQSIPNPWARMLLFQSALDDELHPARPLVENEILDGLELLWSSGSMSGAAPRFEIVNVDDLQAQAEAVGTQRAEDMAAALRALRPRRRVVGPGSPAQAFASLTIVLLDGQPVLASSPYTILFTSEDAAGDRTGSFFRYAAGAARRKLADRPFAFQQYIAQVIVPQLAAPAYDDIDVEWTTVKRLVKPWLDSEVRACLARVSDSTKRARLQPPIGGAWESAASTLLFDEINSLGGLRLFRRATGAQVAESRWRLRSGRPGAPTAPLVIDRSSFDNKYFEGASPVTLPSDLSCLDRNVLPGLEQQYPWVEPGTDWFTERLLLLDEPIEAAHVYGLARFVCNYRGADERLRTARMALPLRRRFFEHFEPSALDRMLKVEIRDSGDVEVSLTIRLGSDDEPRELTVRRTYDSARIHRATGPGVAIWPAFEDPRWRDYVLFRHDTETSVGQNFEITASRAGVEIPSDLEHRTDAVQVLAVRAAPEAIEIRSTVGGTGAAAEDFGVLLPHYRPYEATTQARWNVGIDFGTSNTVVSVRTDGQPVGEFFSSTTLLLPLTRQTENGRLLQAAYFFPETVGAGAFGTAVVHFRRLPSYNLVQERLGVRVNIPFSGHVEADRTNRVVGDLKWSSEDSAYFLTASFLRHLLSVVLAEALHQGIDPSRISIAWAYPRAFSQAQVNQLRKLWTNVLDAFGEDGIHIGEIRDPIDESQAVLQHFFNANQFTTAGDLRVLLDVGGGTSDIAIYGRGATLVLDSLPLGGRNLTGARVQGDVASQLRNPFVEAFVRWAASGQLSQYPVEQRAVTKYLTDGQDHLAFTYLLGTRWFKANGGKFAGDPAFFSFQALVLYFYGALFYYLGLSMREIAARQGRAVPELPYSILVAGNGSLYLDWLTDLVDSHGENVFTRALARMLLDAAGAEGAPPRVERSGKPKSEVALGLVAKENPTPLHDDKTTLTPLVGESISDVDGTDWSFEVIARLPDSERIAPDQVSRLRWTAPELEIERFHRILLAEMRKLSGHGPQWGQLQARLGDVLRGLQRRDLEQATRQRLSYLAARDHEFRGSVFALEAATMLDKLLGTLFQSVPETPAARMNEPQRTGL